ncbi:hypothetical protein EDD22DRAFT_787131 [Suillus occidentalis]|nr:hypothetical protein EDD22DRAFT_787131 [Suillus occidentalis]
MYCTHTRFQGSACDECTDVHRHILHLSKITQDPKQHTNYKYLSLAHLQDIMKTYAKQIKVLKLQELNHSCKYLRCLTQLNNYSHLLMAISEKDISCIHQIIDVALYHGSSVWEIVNKLRDMLEGAYSPQGYDANDLNIVTLIFRLGGRLLLFAMNQILGVPSFHTLCSKSTFTTITPTITPIWDEQFDKNIQNIIMTMCMHSSLASLRGVSLMIDEIALEEMAVHFSKYNKVGGLCWKHSHTVKPVLCTYESVHIA